MTLINLGTAPKGSDGDTIRTAFTKVNNVQVFITVQSFGAKCDGVTDDTAAVQSAIDALPANGGAVVFPAGTTTVVTSALIVSAPNTVLCSWGSHQFTTSLEPSTILDYRGSSVGRIITVQGPAQGFVLQDLSVKSSTVIVGATLIELQTNGTFNHCKIYSTDGNFPNHSIIGINSSSGSNIKILRCYFSGLGTGISLASGNNSDISIVDCTFSNNNYAIVFSGSGGSTNIERNILQDSATGNVLLTNGGGALRIRNNYMEQNLINKVSYCVNVGSSGSLQAVEIASNFMQCNGYSGTSPIIINRVDGCLIANNLFSNCGSVNIVDNVYATSGAGILQSHNISDTPPLAWTNSALGINSIPTVSGWIVGG